MTKIVGLTGGIGSGKSTVARIFIEIGVPVYFADDAGKLVMTDQDVIRKIRNAFGDSVITDNSIDRKKLAQIVFNSPEQLQILNQIVHPAVANHFVNWLNQHQLEPIIIKEAAILFESGTHVNCDSVITVIASEAIRIKRVMERDSVTEEEVKARIRNQWTDEQRINESDFIIYNNGNEDLKNQVLEIYNKLLAR